jgi:hypothetical protein
MKTKTLLTIITESILEPLLIKDLERLGAKGYTLVTAKGQGSRGMRSADWDQNQNIYIEVICDEGVASAIAEYLQREYYSNYAMIIYTSEVQVLRPEKF